MANFNIDYLIIAGGGGGSSTSSGYAGGGAGGAGGYRTSYGTGNISGGNSPVESALNLTIGTPYTITVGDGGAGGPAASPINAAPPPGVKGDDSVFASITSEGGGAGYGQNQGTGGSGGSAGGGGGGSIPGSGGSGTSGQGTNGGTGTSTCPSNACYLGGGGGGASQAGSSVQDGKGGDGLSSSITGSSVIRAGGGSGGSYGPIGWNDPIAGGAGGGGAAGFSSNGYVGQPGTPNTGGGGGGATWYTNQNSRKGGDGGSGIIILRYATADVNYTAAGLTPTETIDGTDTILSFTTVGTGSITFTTPPPPPFSGTKVTTPVTDFNKFNTEEGLKIPSGTSSNQPIGVEGMIRNDTTQSSNGSSSAITYYNGTNWRYFENKPEPIASLIFEPASSIASGQINANKPLGQNFTFTRASTATFLGSNNLLQTAASGVPRIDYVGNTGGHILLEPSRTNIFLQSNNLSNNTWWSEVNGVSLTSSDKNITSPTGTGNDAWTLTTDSGGGLKKVGVRMRNNGTNNHTISASTSKAMSIFVKKSSYDFIYFSSQKFQSDMNGDTWFNISNGTLGTASANHTSTKIEDYGNGWYRLSATVTAPASPADNVGQFSWYVANADTETSVIEDGTSTSFWYGGQIEVGEYGTSYIETVSADVTRVAETASGAGNSTLFNDSEGVLFVEIAALADDGTNRYISLSDGSISNRVNVFFDSNNNLRGYYNGLSGSITINTDIKLNNKIAFKYKSGDSGFWLNGFEVATRTDSLSLSGLDSTSFYLGGGSIFYGKIKQIKVFNTALTDAELASLTT